MKKPRLERPAYACIPHRMCADPRSHSLTPFELAIAGTLLATARRVKQAIHNDRAWQAGAKGIEREIALAAEYKSALSKANALRNRGLKAPLPLRTHVKPTFSLQRGHEHSTHKPVKQSKAIKLAGQHANQRARKRLRLTTKGHNVTFDISRAQLLSFAGMSGAESNRVRLSKALRTLSKPIVLDRTEMKPLLNVEPFAGRLIVTVSGDWLAFQYLGVPLPLSTR